MDGRGSSGGLRGVLDAYSTAFGAREEFQIDYRLRRHDGEWRWFAGHGVASFAKGGSFLGYIGTCVDITDRKAAEAQLSQSRQHISGIIESARDAIIGIDTEQRIVLFNAAAEQTFQRTSAVMLGQPLDCLIPERFRAIHRKHVGEFARAGVTTRVLGRLPTLMGLRGDGSEFPFEASISQAEVGGRTLFTVILRDITERKRLDERREALVRELNHRVKNTLAVVLGLASQTVATVPGPDAFQQAFMHRVQALARAHDLLTRADWVSTSLAEVAHHAVSPYGLERFEIEGPHVMLEPRAAVILTLAFNELATNATKYGALSAPGGRVAIKWHEQVQGIELLWRSAGSKRLFSDAARLWFKNDRANDHLRVRGDSELAFAPEGVICRMRFPFNSRGLLGA